ncbi:HNH endonuclease domain-containing protein [Methanofollis fontis]|uniref:HNH nuclease domain-containing protein n=1 Tax=Methanofollis fontis TaxID=2052832 RepID=A0A483CRW9_9EURY|nr:HNH endonuclease domain-containing protein [Methanofollis fontis]TAJ43880.1 hypothetical protein CUJ86_07395 [Methanofollis fontis]
MDLAEYQKINAIIARDSADATYKYALLRGVIEVCQQSLHLEEADPDRPDRLWFPLGLLIEKWILYYYPIFAAPTFIPQKNGETRDQESGKNVSFRRHFIPVIEYYRERGGISVFYNDYFRGRIPDEIQPDFLTLVRAIRTTITGMPMKHLGYSQSGEHYSVFDFDRPLPRLSGGRPIDRIFLIEHAGRFSLSRELCTIFSYFGSFISGDECLLRKWAAFTAGADRTQTVSEEFMFSLLSETPTTERAIADAQRIYRSALDGGGGLRCVWSGRAIPSASEMHIDHLLPFSIWKNNDLWNLLPALSSVNAKKSDRIPDPSFLKRRKEEIIGCWDLLHDPLPRRFEEEVRISLIGPHAPWSDWQDLAIEHLADKCRYLIEIRGNEAWAL